MNTGNEQDKAQKTMNPVADNTEKPVTKATVPTPAVIRNGLVEGCNTCKLYGGGMMPPHFASPRCESGGRNHCTCGICF